MVHFQTYFSEFFVSLSALYSHHFMYSNEIIFVKTFLLIPDETGFKEEIIKTIGIVDITEIA